MPLSNEIAYAAGLFDGEGTVAIYETTVGKAQNNPRPAFLYQAQIANTDWRVIEWLCQTFGGTWARKSQGKAHWKRGYVWRLTGAKAHEFFVLIHPLTIIKAEEIAIALAFRRMLTPRNKRQTEDMLTERRAAVAHLKDRKHAK